ncbi:MAG: mycofactocin-associated electron transfer flavoprotein alpha subunit [Acidimicrobiales bacterium]
MIAVVPVRAGELPVGALEAVAEAGGNLLLVGEGTDAAAEQLTAQAPLVAKQVACAELGSYAPAAWARRLLPLLEAEDVVILPAVPDGRDLAPRIAAGLGRPLLAGAQDITATGATVLRHGGLQLVELSVDGPFVATLLPGVRSVVAGEGAPGSAGAAPTRALGPADDTDAGDDGQEGPDAMSLEVLAPDPAAVDLAEAAKIMSGGAGLGGHDEFALLADVAEAVGASVGATRVVTDGGILGHARQIGTTGATVRPRLYVALGISGAAQHVGGIGEPLHVVSVNLDASCPMMAMADLAIVSDAAATLEALADLLGLRAGALVGEDRSGEGDGA